MADIKTLKDNKTQVLPRTTSAAVMNDNGEPIENDISSIGAPVVNTANTLNVVNGTSANNIAQSLVELQSVKSDLKTALAEKGQTVGDVFSEYPAAVRAIETGGGVATVSIRVLGSDIRTWYIDESGNVQKTNSTSTTITCLKNSLICVFWENGSPAETWKFNGGCSLVVDGETVNGSLDYIGVYFALMYVSGDGSFAL